MWAATGTPIPEDELSDPEAVAPAGDVTVRVLAVWVAVSFLVRAHELRKAGKQAQAEGRAAQPRTAHAAGDKSSGA